MFVKEVIELNSEQFRNCDLGDERGWAPWPGAPPQHYHASSPKTGPGAAQVELVLSNRRGALEGASQCLGYWGCCGKGKGTGAPARASPRQQRLQAKARTTTIFLFCLMHAYAAYITTVKLGSTKYADPCATK